MKINRQHRSKIFYFLLLLSAACQSSPPPPMTEPAEEAENKDAPGVDLPAEIAKIPSAPSPGASPSSKPTIQRIFPESTIAAPDKDSASRNIAYDTLLSARAPDTRNTAGWQYRSTSQGKIVGFEFSNQGGNRILPPRRDAVKNQFFARDFQFRFDERARQDIHLLVADWVASRDRQFRLSELMNSLMHFLPRNVLPAIVTVRDRNIVTLPTGEEVEFDATTHEILGGVLAEAPVDLNPDRSARKFPAIEYKGKGVMVRADARGADPRLSTTALITNGAPPEDCAKDSACAQCQVPSRELWEQSGAVRFKFASDQAFNRFLIARCGFGLPTNGGGFAIAAPTQ